MKKLEVVDICDCSNKLLIIGFLKKYDSEDKSLKYPLVDILDGHLCLKKDIIVDNGWYNEDGIYNTYFDVYSVYYPIECCPICSKKYEYVERYDESLKLV